MATPSLYTAHSGERWADFGSGGHPPAWYAALRAAGYTGVILDTYSAQPTDVAGALNAGLAVQLFQGYDPAAWSDLGAASTRATQAVAFAQQVGYLAKATLWLDFEDCATPPSAAAAWINGWSRAILQAGYFPGLYVGAPEPLTGEALYALLLHVMHYWRSVSQVPTVARRGWQMLQEQGNVAVDGVLIDVDRVQMDALGGLPHGMILPAPAPAPSPPDVATLQAEVARLKTIIGRVQDAVKGV